MDGEAEAKGDARFLAEAREWLARHDAAVWRREFVGHVESLELCRRWQATKASAGWACLTWPVEHGGRAATARQQLAWAHEEGWLAELSKPFVIGIGMAGPTLIAHGSEAQRRRYLKPIATGSELWCQLFSEPGAGSDLAGIRTRATRDGDQWRIQGQKVWTSFAQVADFAILLARSDPSVPKHRGLTYFVLDMHAPGVSVRPLRQATGESEFNEVFIDDVLVSDDQRVGAVDDGWRVAMTTLAAERLAIADIISTNAAEIIALAQAARLGRRDDPADQELLARLADWLVTADGVRRAAWRVAGELDRSGGTSGSGVPLKLALGLGKQRMASLALEIEGAFGLVAGRDESLAAGLFQHVLLRSAGHRIEGGTDEVLRTVIGERVLGLPPEPRADKQRPFADLARPGAAAGS